MTAKPWRLWQGVDRDIQIGRVDETWRQEIARDPYLRDTLVVVEVVFGDGTRFRFATDSLTTTTDDLQDRAVQAGLVAEPEIADGYEFSNPAAAARTVGELVIPAGPVDVAARRARGFPLQGHAEISLLRDGMSWNRRRVLLRGTMAGGVQFGPVRSGTTSADGTPYTTDHQVVRFGVQDPRAAAETAFPPHVATAEAWPDLHPSAVGQPYPVIYGGTTTSTVRVSTSTTTPRFVVAYGHGWEVERVYRNGENVTGNFTAAEDYDGLGVPVTTVTATSGTYAEADRITAKIVHTANPSPDLLDIVADVLARFSSGGRAMLSGPLFAEARARLGQVPAIAQANASSTVLRFVEENLLDAFPMISMLWSGGRLGPVVTDYRTQPRTQLRNYGARLLYRLTDPVETPSEELFTEFTVRHSYDAAVDQFLGYRFAGPHTDPRCRLAREVLDIDRPYPVIESLAIGSDLVASYVVDWLAAHLTLPSTLVDYAAAPRVFLELRPGDTVALSDPDFGWVEERATVDRLTYRRGQAVAGLRVWPGALRVIPRAH